MNYDTKTFKAFEVTEQMNSFTGNVIQKTIAQLPPNDVLIKVHYSAINYKDLLSCKGNKGVTKLYPHTPGIDAAGEIIDDRTGSFSKGEEVIVMGFDLGMNTAGGFGQYIRVPQSWVLRKPNGITLKESMIMGTGALTAARGIDKMIRIGQTPSQGAIVVTGATGGVGSFAVEILSKCGFEVWASTGKPEEANYLKKLGATQVIHRDELIDASDRPVLRTRWAGAFDTVGGETLVNLLKACGKEGAIATCGNLTGATLSLTGLPFILNGVNLLGINAADTPIIERKRLWELLSTQWKPTLKEVVTPIELHQLNESLKTMEQSLHKGRFLLSHLSTI